MREDSSFRITRYERLLEELKEQGYRLIPTEERFIVSSSMGDVGEIQRNRLVVYFNPSSTESQRAETSKLLAFARNF